MISAFLNIPNLDLLSVGVAVAGMVVLGFVTLFSDLRNSSNRIFFYLATTASIWGILNYFSYQPYPPDLSLWLLRLVMFFAVWSSFFTFTFAYVFPAPKINLSRSFKWILIPLTFIVTTLTLTPLVFSQIAEVTSTGNIARVINGPGIFVFGLTVISLNLAGIVFLVRKIIKSSKMERKPIQIVLVGFVLMLSLIIIFNFFLPAFFDNPRFIPLGAMFLFPFVAFTAYAIIRHKLFNIKVAGAGLLVFALSITAFGEVIFARELSLIIYRSSIFVLVLAFGTLLIREVLREVRQREEIELLARDLSKANTRLRELDRQKSEFVSIASHQLRSPLTAIRGYASLVLEESYGKLPEGAKEAVRRIADSSYQMVNSVEDFLNVSRIEQGRMKYDLAVFDLSQMIQKVVDEMLPVAQKKGLGLTYEAAKNEKYSIKADEGKIRQVIANIVDNCIKYTPRGSIHVNLQRTPRPSSGQATDKLLTTITDTGVWMSKETLGRLFSKDARADNASRTNVGGTGLGLYVAKQFVDAHNGRIWAKSAGEGKGSSFFIELNAA